MLYYDNYQIVTQEIPNELSLGISIMGCPIHCPDCHSKHLWKEKGKPLPLSELQKIIDKQKYMTCILFLGGDWKNKFHFYLWWLREEYANKYKLALYSGYPLINAYRKQLLPYLDYIKVGQYIQEKGDLTSPNTNQILFKKENNKLINITHLFWEKK